MNGKRETTPRGLVLPASLGDEQDDIHNWQAFDSMLAGTHATHNLPHIDSEGALVDPAGNPIGGGAGGSPTNLSATTTATAVTVVSSTGSDATLAAASGSAAGVMTAADKTKLDGIATGATANATDAQLRDRSTHTGTQAISTVAGLQTALDSKQAALTAGSGISLINDVISATGGSATVVNDLTTGGTTSALSAEMGKALNETKKDRFVAGETITTSRALASTDRNKIAQVDTSAAAVTLTLNTGAILAADDIILLRRVGSNALNIVAGTATLSNPANITVANGDLVAIVGVAANVAVLQGNDAAAAKLNAVQSYTKNQAITPVVVPYAATITPNAESSATHNIGTLTGNITIANPTNLFDGCAVNFIITQDATGGRTVTFGNQYATAGGAAPTINTTANAKTIISGRYYASVGLVLINSLPDVKAIV